MNEIVLVMKDKHDVGAFFFKFVYPVLLFIFLLFSNVWLVATIVNVDVFENMNNVLNNLNLVLIIVVVSQIYRS